MVSANLRDANLQDARLQGAKLHGANVVGVDFRHADLVGAFFNTDTVLGGTFDPAAYGMLFSEDGQA
jgi:uncharacterized protein YjbI with pentapeptide repeats